MFTKYNPSEIEPKWQKYWVDHGTFKSVNGSAKPKKYVLVEFPYPSGTGLHMGHVRPFTAGDLMARYYRSRGFEVMYPFGWDAFGLPAENYAIKMGVQPEVSTAANIANAKRQVLSWGTSFDWSREVNTTDPSYYRWTQWLFLKFFEKGLAYEATAMLNWCPKDKTVLANEEVIDGACERCGTQVERREMRQWFLKITSYAQALLDGLKDLNWPEPIKVQQANWIGRSDGAEIDFDLESDRDDRSVTVFTTRPDTLFGVTYVVLAPEHALVHEMRDSIQNWDEVTAYVEESRNKTDIQRSSLDREKTGVELKGVQAINPANGEKVPVWIADYVLATYGTGAIMAVPAHDDRDLEFAKKFNLPVREVVNADGKLVSSGSFSGSAAADAAEKITAEFGCTKVQYKLRDWVFSRQRYWGEPIPIIHCEKCGAVAVPEDQLPVALPKVDHYEPTGTGESPLAAIPEWVNVTCPKCGGAAKRETNTMPQWAGSSWYFLRYCDPQNSSAFASPDTLKYWMPIDLYFGGMEHTTLHLLYSRFWNLFLFDQGLVPVREPYSVRKPHGIILGPDGEKMSKSRGNVVSPDEIVTQHGADTMRMYEFFLGPHDQVIGWSDRGIIGVRRFLDRAWNFVTANIEDVADEAGVDVELHRLIKKVTEDIEATKFNTAVAAFMEFMNAVEGKHASKQTLEAFLTLLSPFAPHLTEELWSQLGHGESIALAAWPSFDESKLVASTVRFAVQVDGKLRGTLDAPAAHVTQADVDSAAREIQTVKTAIGTSEVAKVVFVPNRLINFVLKK